MAKVTEISNERGTYMFYCPGCKCSHAYYTKDDEFDGSPLTCSKPIWHFNGDIEKPTFNPSLKNTYPDGKVCHLFVENGKIKYCDDCYHELKSKTIEMEDII